MFKLIVSIVPHDSGELITSAAASKGAGGGTIMMARGTAQSNIIQLLGLGDTSKDIAYVIVDDSIYEDVRSEIILRTENKKKSFGVLFSVDLGEFIKAGDAESKAATLAAGGNMANEDSYQMINVIVNKGYADDAMAAARKAGAGGGTIMSARGTAKEGDAKFLGMEIVPEKDLLMIVVPTEKAPQIVQAIKELPCMQKAGSGIIFCNEAHGFTLLGKN
ncbi:MAG: transcriptional regulator [Treponema sp.]|nr:transcriptional regulator [Treponema sp.]